MEAAATPSANEEANPIGDDVEEEGAIDNQVSEEDEVDQEGIIGGLEEEDFHKTKWTKYITDKKKLIDDGSLYRSRLQDPALLLECMCTR